jgi:hypothetical protein
MRTRHSTTTVRVIAATLALQATLAHAVLDTSKLLPKNPPQPTDSTPVASGGGSASSSGGGGGSSSGACAASPWQCFGVVGLACDGVLSTEAEAAIVAASGAIGLSALTFAGSVLETEYSGCAPDGSCVVNAGSWDHDQCCFAHPSGHFCGIDHAFASGSCTNEWNEAVHRVVHGLNWRRRPDQCRVDDDGIVDFATYCAPAGAIVAKEDRAKCCGRRTRRFDLGRDWLQAASQALILDGTYTPRVCVGGARGGGIAGGGGGSSSGGTSTPHSTPGPTCATDAACPTGSICISTEPNGPKHCVQV